MSDREPIADILMAVTHEVLAAEDKHRPLGSPHEGWAVIREELDELWEHVRRDTGRGSEARREAIQIAAVAVRYVRDVTQP